MSTQRTYTLNFMGDVMLGRLIDQMFPQHVHEPEEQRIAQSLLKSHPKLSVYSIESPWGNALPLLHSADLNLINLETSATTHAVKWPDKIFNYRMHPANISALTVAKVHYAGLANNHTLDFSEPGLSETVKTVKGAGIAFAGAGESRFEATRPAILRLPAGGGRKELEAHVWAASDHPGDWASVANFHLIDYSQATRQRLKALLTAPASSQAALKVFSVHWGPNYAWQPSKEIRDLAHFLVDECGVDVIHGHSSHHVQGVERYRGSVIIYGCGDFIDDYALVKDFRNDLSGIWQVRVEQDFRDEDGGKLRLTRLEMFPTKIDRFQVRRLMADEPDTAWIADRIRGLSADVGTQVQVDDREGDLKLIVDLSSC
ncbi:putative polyglutamate biosynthesis protein [Teratosphaeria nubilosa]|uniref:Putative polyglutamate biosynthesis protein n=1 Tax=Teratosphaeria nubilosa TaxID=161662 RepID=A0A6G1L2B4_9PEZI|nr:putative polyglutamate biosynthesis protein [Teratosphaeria nubilosa]